MNTLQYVDKQDLGNDMQVWVNPVNSNGSINYTNTNLKMYILDLEGSSKGVINLTKDSKGLTFKTSALSSVGAGTFAVVVEVHHHGTDSSELFPTDDSELVTLVNHTSGSNTYLILDKMFKYDSSTIIPTNASSGEPGIHINNVDFNNAIVNLVSADAPARVYLNAQHNIVFDVPKGEPGSTWQPYIAPDGHWHVKLVAGRTDGGVSPHDLSTLEDYINNHILNGKR